MLLATGGVNAHRGAIWALGSACLRRRDEVDLSRGSSRPGRTTRLFARSNAPKQHKATVREGMSTLQGIWSSGRSPGWFSPSDSCRLAEALPLTAAGRERNKGAARCAA